MTSFLPDMEKEFKTFQEFYPFYLSEHNNAGTRILHFIGTTFFFIFIIVTIFTMNFWYLLGAILIPYLFAWLGHFFVEHNTPATFKYPLMSLRGDFKLYFELLFGKEKFSVK